MIKTQSTYHWHPISTYLRMTSTLEEAIWSSWQKNNLQRWCLKTTTFWHCRDLPRVCVETRRDHWGLGPRSRWEKNGVWVRFQTTLPYLSGTYLIRINPRIPDGERMDSVTYTIPNEFRVATEELTGSHTQKPPRNAHANRNRMEISTRTRDTRA